MKLYELNGDCLLHICSYLEERDLFNLSLVHRTLHRVIDQNVFYAQTLDLLMCGHRDSPAIEARSLWPLNYAQRLRIGRNWLMGRYREYQYFPHSRMFPTKLLLDRDWLHVTHCNYIRQHRRLRPEPLQRHYTREITGGQVRSDVADMARHGDTLFAAHTCGSAFIYEDYGSDGGGGGGGDSAATAGGIVCAQRLHSPKEYVHCVDFAGEMYASSTDKEACVWRRSEEFGCVHLDRELRLLHAYKTLRFGEHGDRLYGGIYTDLDRRALREIDLITGRELPLNSNTLSIYDLRLKDEHVLFTANFDTSFRLHDRRTGCDESVWEDPFDSSFYCLEYDGLHAVLCGTKYHGRVNLYDIRVPLKYVQLYFPYRGCGGERQNDRDRGHSSSPVYSVACDSRFMFVATDRNVRVFDFKADCAVSRDYRDIFRETLRYTNTL